MIPKINALLKIGESYIFEDYKNAKLFFEKSLETLGYVSSIGIEKKKKVIENKCNFLFVHQGEETNCLEEGIHYAELVYLKIKKQKNY
ncbi:hypothetical protein [Bacillus mycoides]|uniref:hypothetical protein n=1 Tax=Bacillus mycoides TaxID=1405 RepID=UPI000B43F3BE